MADTARLLIVDDGYIYLPADDLSDAAVSRILTEYDRWVSGRGDGHKGLLVLRSPAEVVDMRGRP